ncbi:MAG: O-antigen ligase family protein, partial [Cytophagales bacterium]
IFDKIVKKLYLEDPSARIRVFTWEIAYDHWLKSPILGNGPGFGNQNGFRMYNEFFGYQNTYLKMFAETGIFSLIFFIVFLIRKGIVILTIQDSTLKKMLLITFIACSIHWFIADCYYHPSFWISLASVGLLTDKKLV